MGIFSTLGALAAPNLKDRSKHRPQGAWIMVGNLPKREIPLALQWIVRSGRYFLLYRFLDASAPGADSAGPLNWRLSR